MKIIIISLIIALLSFGCALGKLNNEQDVVKLKEATTSSKPIDNNVETKQSEALQTLFALEMNKNIESLDRNGTQYAVYVNIPGKKVEYTYGNKPMGSASMIKVFILEKAYYEISQGTLSEDVVLTIEKDTRVGGAGSMQSLAIGTPIKIKVLLEKMIAESDNTATNMLIKHFGMDNINKYMQERGYSESLLCRKMMDYESLRAGRDNVTSVKDLGLFFSRLLAGNAVNKELDKRMIEILKLQEDSNKIPFFLPKGTIVAHKTGEINSVMNDGGIVLKEEPYVVCILTDKAPEYNLSIKQVANLAKKIDTSVDLVLGKKNNTPNDKIPVIIDKPVKHTEHKDQLIKEYSLRHYGESIKNIVPRAIVIHWTASDTVMSAFNWFDKDSYMDDNRTLNVGSQFLVDRDGTIYRLMDETMLARHSIGYNWCSIGIENVGGTNGFENLTEAQLTANVELIRYLSNKYNTIGYVWGHYQQDKAKASGLYKENVSGYYSGKSDPGPKFMKKLRENLVDSNLTFYDE